MIKGSHCKRGWDPRMGEGGRGQTGALHPPVPLAARHQPWWSVPRGWTSSPLLLSSLLLYPGHLALPRTTSARPSISCLAPCFPEQTEEVGADSELGNKWELWFLFFMTG